MLVKGGGKLDTKYLITIPDDLNLSEQYRHRVALLIETIPFVAAERR